LPGFPLQRCFQGKPTKGDRYHLLDGDPYVYEDTPTGLAVCALTYEITTVGKITRIRVA